MCVTHRPCVSVGFVYDPFRCGVCTPNVEFLGSVEYIDKSCIQYLSIKDSWDAVRRAARRKKLSASWFDVDLHDSIFGKTRRSASLPRSDPASVPLVELGGGQDPIVMTVSSPSHVGVGPNMYPSFSVPQSGGSGGPSSPSGVVSPEIGLSESGSDFPGFEPSTGADVSGGSVPCAQYERVAAPSPVGVGVSQRGDRSPSPGNPERHSASAGPSSAPAPPSGKVQRDPMLNQLLSTMSAQLNTLTSFMFNQMASSGTSRSSRDCRCFRTGDFWRFAWC